MWKTWMSYEATVKQKKAEVISWMNYKSYVSFWFCNKDTGLVENSSNLLFSSIKSYGNNICMMMIHSQQGFKKSCT